MSPIELLKSGIQGGNWQDVCDAYKTLTGQSLQPPVQALGGNELDSALRGVLHMALDEAFDGCFGKGKKPKTKPAPQANLIVMPTAEEAEAVLLMDEARIEYVTEPELTNAETEPDGIKPEDIDGEGPTEALKNAGTSAHKTVYNETMRFVSGNAGQGEVERNRRKAQATAQHKQVRPEPPVYEVECSKCGRTFQSPTKPNSHVGQKCARCIRNMERPEK